MGLGVHYFFRKVVPSYLHERLFSICKSYFLFVYGALCQVLAYAQQSRERANSEQVLLADRMQEYRQQMERDNQRSLSVDTTTGGDGIQAVGRSSHKMIEAVMQSTPRGKVGI